MKHFKDIDATIAYLQAVVARSDVEVEQKKNVEQAIKYVKRLRRTPHCKTPEVYRCVRQVADLLLRTFEAK